MKRFLYADGEYINIDTIDTIYISHTKETNQYFIRYSCIQRFENDTDHNSCQRRYDLFSKPFESRSEAEKFMHKFMEDHC